MDFTFEDIGLPLTPTAPHVEDELNLLSGDILGPLGLKYIYAG